MSAAARALSSIEEYRRASRNSGSGIGDVPAAGNADVGASLCARELQALELLAQGLADKEIARAMHISVRTVQNHLARVREKTGARRRAQLTRWAMEHVDRERD